MKQISAFKYEELNRDFELFYDCKIESFSLLDERHLEFYSDGHVFEEMTGLFDRRYEHNVLLVTDVDYLKEKYDECRENCGDVEHAFLALLKSQVYHSCALDNERVTKSDVEVILNGCVVPEKTMREHLDIVGMDNALKDVVVMANASKNQSITMKEIIDIHKLVLLGDEMGGVLRYHGAEIYYRNTLFARGIEVPELTQLLIEWTSSSDYISMHPVDRCIHFHAIFIKIHPFLEGNGRTARILSILILLKAGFPPLSLSIQNKVSYTESLNNWDNNITQPFGDLIWDNIKHSLKSHIIAFLNIKQHTTP